MSRSKSRKHKEKPPPQEPVPGSESSAPSAPLDPGEGLRERAPSTMRPDEPIVARLVGLVGLFLASIGGVAMLVAVRNQVNVYVPPEFGACVLAVGIVLLLFHAMCDGDEQFRRMYAALGYALFAAAIFLSVAPVKDRPFGAWFLPFGAPLDLLGLLFLSTFLRHEDAPGWSERSKTLIGLLGAGMALAGLIGGSISTKFLMPNGLVLALLGFVHLWVFILAVRAESDIGYRTAQLLGIGSAVAGLVALGRGLLPPLFFELRWLGTRPEPYLVPSGLALIVLGTLGVLLAVGLASDRTLVVLTRRELTAYFHSPIAYIVIFGFNAVAWIVYTMFVFQLFSAAIQQRVLAEPIVHFYLLKWEVLILLFLLGIPLVTMRLMSEEWSRGTYEVLLTAPLNEFSVVLSKFLGAFLFYLLLWLPWGLYLVAFYIGSGQEFEYRPLLSFFISVACIGAGFLSAGLFFSSLTRDQIVAAVLSGAYVLGFLLLWMIKNALLDFNVPEDNFWVQLLGHVSYIDIVIKSLARGLFVPRPLIFQLSAAVFWLFATTKVLEMRKWN